jgi:glycosyltransferase involved in cell wall biosynthesis
LKIVYFYQYFSTPKGSWGTRVYEFAKDWVKKGHEVTIITSIYSKSDLKARKLIEDQYFDGIHVKVLNIYIDNKQIKLRRIWSFIKYFTLSSWYALTVEADIVIASSGPITVGIPGLVAKIIRRRKLIFETRDLWPDGAIELGIISNSIVKKIAYWFELICYKNASHIVCLSPGMVKNIEKRFGYKKLTSISNSVDMKMFSKNIESLPPIFYKDKKIAIYTGNIGLVNNSFLLLRAAIKLKELNNNEIVIVLIGDGQQKDELLEIKLKMQLNNFIILDLMTKMDLVKFIKHSMVSIVPLKDTAILDTSSPNKLFEALAAGIPVIQNTKGWIKDLLEDNMCGITVNADNESELVQALIKLSKNDNLVKLMGENGRKLAEKEFTSNFLADKMLKVIENVHSSK